MACLNTGNVKPNERIVSNITYTPPRPLHDNVIPMHTERQGTCIKFDKGHITHKKSSAQNVLQICTSISLSVISTKILNLKEPKFPEK